MKSISRFLVFALALVSFDAISAPVATTVGSNLTAYNQGSGAINNNSWNNMTNSRVVNTAGGGAPTADFGNCNSLILRCAQPKCANGGCSSMDVASSIVAGCVESNSTCKQYGNDLINFIAAQLVSDSTAKVNQQAAAAQTAAAQAAAQQSAQQLQQMQAQMQQMQAQMQQQSEQSAQQLQAALEQQSQLTAQAIAQANANAQQAAQTNASSTGSNVSNTIQQVAAASGVSADVLLREQVSGEIMDKIDSAEAALKNVQAAMNTTFTYAGCDSSGSNCTGPKRVKVFKQKAMQFFDPYNSVLDELYDALILAQSVGVDITDIYMMLNGTCNVWGQYLCGPGQVMHYNSTNCQNGRSVPVTTAEGTVRGGAQCEVGKVVPMSDGGCQLIKMLTNDEEVQRNWLYPETGSAEGVQVRVGCASEALDNSMLFRNRKKQASIDIEVLQRMIEQDAPSVFGGNAFGQNKKAKPDGIKYCAVNPTTYPELQKSVALKTLPSVVCVADNKLEGLIDKELTSSEPDAEYSMSVFCGALWGEDYEKCACENGPDKIYTRWQTDDKGKNGQCVCKDSTFNNFDLETGRCVDGQGKNRADKDRGDAIIKNLQKDGVNLYVDMDGILRTDSAYENNEAVCKSLGCNFILFGTEVQCSCPLGSDDSIFNKAAELTLKQVKNE